MGLNLGPTTYGAVCFCTKHLSFVSICFLSYNIGIIIYTSHVLWEMGKVTWTKTPRMGLDIQEGRVLQMLVETEYELNVKLDISSP